MKELKLSIEMIPKQLWGKSLASLLRKPDWDIVRRETYQRYSHSCGICRAKGRVECHEVWEYDEKTNPCVQKLIATIALCSSCHMVKHWGRSERLGLVSKYKLVDHFCNVNNCTKEDLVKHKNIEYGRWLLRGGYDWVIDYNIIPVSEDKNQLQITDF